MDKGIDIEEAKAELQAAISAPGGQYWSYTPAVSSLIEALEQAQHEYQAIEQKLINAAVYIETLESEPRKKNLKLLNEIAGLKRTCEQLEAASIKVVNLPDAFAIRSGHPINEDERSVMIPKDGGNWYSRLDIEHALRVAGVKFDGGE